MNIIKNIQGLAPLTVKPQTLPLKVTDAKHITENGKFLENITPNSSNNSDFGSMVINALNKTSNLQQDSLLLQQQNIISPDSVDTHTVSIAMAKAEMALDLTKAVVDRSIQAYRELTTLR